ncbi:MAG TPA: Holliday junction resolvase-like protein [archaeon]|nr:Holliday junction resolvase-like protein [archaeon]
MPYEEVMVALALVAALFALLYYLERKNSVNAMSLLTNEKFRGKSLSVKYGKMSEQFFPFLDSYPYDRQNFRFLGAPIDGVQFEKDGIVFVEFKTAGSQLSERQKEIKWLVKNGKVDFREIRIA